jgi:FixJ family two-component response regulator
MGDAVSATSVGGQDEVRIVDDDPQVLAYLARVIGSMNYVVRSFSNPAAMLGDDPGRTPACLIVDLQMPGADGLDVIGRARKQWPLTPAILVSGHVNVPLTVAAMRQGAAGVLEKPVRPEDLTREVAAVIERSRRRTTAEQEQAEARRLVADLSEQELKLMRLLVEGTPNKNIATQMNLAIRTVEKYRRIIFDKLGVDSAAEATRVWVLATLEE